MNDIIISPCTSGDIPDLVTIATTAYNQHYTYLWYDNGHEYVARQFNQNTLHQEMNSPGSAFYLLYYQGHLAGFLKLKLEAALTGYNGSECLELERIYILKAATGKGVGQQVMHFILRLARERSKRVVWLKAMDSSTEAIRFYEKAGFVKCGSLVLEMPQMKEELRGMCVMKLEVDQPASDRKSRPSRNLFQRISRKELNIG